MTGTTQAQIDALKATVAQLTTQVNVLTPCSVIPPPSQFFITQFNSAYCGNRTRYACNIDGNGNPIGPAAISSVVDQSTANSGRIIWGDSCEYHQLITAPPTAPVPNEQWSICKGFGDMPSGNFYALGTVRADWGCMDTNGPYRDIATIFSAPKQGGPFCPLILPPTGTYRVRMWMWVHNNDGSPNRPCYSEQQLTFGQNVNNPAWQGAPPQNRPGIRYREIWWDPAAGWVRGTAPTLPFFNAGTPTSPVWTQPLIITPTFQGTDVFGQDEGVLWQYLYPDFKTAVTKAI